MEEVQLKLADARLIRRVSYLLEWGTPNMQVDEKSMSGSAVIVKYVEKKRSYSCSV